MEDHLPLISIITATYNSIRFFHDTSRSVLQSEVRDFEWIIVDDGSSDGTRELLEKLKDNRIKLHIKSVNAGIEDSYATGINLAKGKYLLILDHDDTIPKGSLLKRITELQSNISANAAFGAVSYMTEDGKVYRESKFPLLRSTQTISSIMAITMLFAIPIYPLKQGCVVLRTNFVKENKGLYDIQLFLKASKSGPVIYVAEPCLNYRTFRTQFSSSRRIRVIRFLQFVWAKYAFVYLPWYVSPFAAIYRTIPEFAKVIWSFVSSKRI